MDTPEARKRWQLPQVFSPPVDFYALLETQAAKTLEGVLALHAWIEEGDESNCQRVRDLEREADQLKLNLERKLVESFVTPFDREDIYDLSARLDEVINGAKYVVREIEALELSLKDSFLRSMSEVLVEGTRCLHLSFANLKSNLKEASDQASLACKSETRFSKIYRQAMRQLFALDDVKKILKTREVYRYMLQASEKVDKVGKKLSHIIVKIG
jgi:uncharacterized protein Yka (UPF0111/DUF47 family)